jgi:hypothetical protein
MKYVIISDPNHCAGGHADFRVHAEGCRDIERHLQKPHFGLAGSIYTIEAATPEAAIAEDLADFLNDGMGFDESNYVILPCARTARAT